MDEQILSTVVGRDEPVPLIVAEPLHSSGCHMTTSSTGHERAEEARPVAHPVLAHVVRAPYPQPSDRRLDSADRVNPGMADRPRERRRHEMVRRNDALWRP